MKSRVGRDQSRRTAFRWIELRRLESQSRGRILEISRKQLVVNDGRDSAARGRVIGYGGSPYDLVGERDAFQVVFLQPGFRGVLTREDLEMFGIANVLLGIDVNPDGHARSLFAFRELFGAVKPVRATVEVEQPAL